jgi:hypothetical protein
LRAAGNSYREIALHLQQLGLPSKQGGQWVHTAIRGILTRKAG